MDPHSDHPSRTFWDQAAQENAAWHVATGHESESSEFFAEGSREVDAFLAFTDAKVLPTDTVLEIGCGVGRMTQRLSELAGLVIGVDVSGEMISRAREHLGGRKVRLELVAGDGTLDLADDSVDVVFSYITFQHVPTATEQLRYFRESARILKPGGRIAVQIRAQGLVPRTLDWAGHFRHRLRSRKTFASTWRGSVVSQQEVAVVLSSLGLTPHFKAWGRRHVWVCGEKQSPAGEAGFR